MSTASKTPDDTTNKDYVDILLYCAKPSKYAGLPKASRDHYDVVCKMIEAAKPEQKANLRLFWEGVGKTVGLIANLLSQLPYMLTVGIFTDPSQLSLMLLTDPKFGLPAGQARLANFSKQLFNSTVDDMNRWGFKFIQKMQVAPKPIPGSPGWMSRNIAQPLSRKATYLLNRVVLTQCVRNAFQRVVTQSAGRVAGFASVRAFIVVARLLGAAATMAAAKILTMLVKLNPLMMKLMIVQIIGMIVDSFDPCELNRSMDAETLKQFSTSFDDQFRDMMILQHNIVFSGMSMSSEGEEEIQFMNQWPIDVKVETLFPYYPFNKAVQDKDLKNARMVEFGLTDEDETSREELVSMYALFYLDNLKFNAYGQPLLFPENYDPSNIEPETLQVMQQQVNHFFANNNPVVSRWLVKYSPLILVAIAGLLFIIFKFIQ